MSLSSGDRIGHYEILNLFVPLARSADLSPAKPCLLFKMSILRAPEMTPGFTSYDITRDGRRFVAVGPNDSTEAPRRILVTLHWLDELKRTFSK